MANGRNAWYINTRRDGQTNGKQHPVGNRMRGGRWIMEFVFISLLVLFDFPKLYACITLPK